MIMKLNEYEKSGLAYYTDRAEDKKIVTADNFDVRAVQESITDELGNPYRQMFRWIQMEI
jgi:hypothetical protein